MVYKLLIIILLSSCSHLPDISECPSPKIINKSELAIDNHDRSMLQNVIDNRRCASIYPNDVCVDTFYKLAYHHYYVTCTTPIQKEPILGDK